jgi:acyl carrier protein
MPFATAAQTQRTKTGNGGSVDIDDLRAVIAKYLKIDVGRVTDDAHLSQDLGADWLDRLELIILIEDIAGVEITDNEADRIDVVRDLIDCVGEQLRACGREILPGGLRFQQIQ